MVWTEEARRRGAETRHQNVLARRRAVRESGKVESAEAESAEMESSPLMGDLLPSEDQMASRLKSLAAALASAADDQIASDGVINQIEQLLSKVTARDFPKLAESRQIQDFLEAFGERAIERNPSLPPGTLLNAGTLAAQKVPWTWKHVNDMVASGEMPLATWTPSITTEIGWNNLIVVVGADAEVTLPKCFYDVYMESRRLQKAARQHANVLFKRADRVDPDVADVISRETAIVRSAGHGGTYLPGGGFFAIEAGEPETGPEGAPEAAGV